MSQIQLCLSSHSFRLCSHQGSGSSVEDDVEITEDEADRQSAENVERWVSAHIIPVGAFDIAAGST